MACIPSQSLSQTRCSCAQGAWSLVDGTMDTHIQTFAYGYLLLLLVLIWPCMTESYRIPWKTCHPVFQSSCTIFHSLITTCINLSPSSRSLSSWLQQSQLLQDSSSSVSLAPLVADKWLFSCQILELMSAGILCPFNCIVCLSSMSSVFFVYSTYNLLSETQSVNIFPAGTGWVFIPLLVLLE